MIDFSESQLSQLNKIYFTRPDVVRKTKAVMFLFGEYGIGHERYNGVHFSKHDFCRLKDILVAYGAYAVFAAPVEPTPESELVAPVEPIPESEPVAPLVKKRRGERGKGKKPAAELVAIRIPSDYLRQIDSIVLNQSLSRTEVILLALKQYLLI